MQRLRSSAFSVSLISSVLVTAAAGTGCERAVTYPEGLSWGDPALPAYTNQVRLGVSCNGDDSIAFVNHDAPDMPKLLGSASVGFSPIESEGPHHLTSTSDGKYIFFNLSNYVTNGGSGPHGAHGTGTVPGYLVKLDVHSGRQVGQVLVDRSPGDVVRSRDDKLIYVSHYDLARLTDALTRGLPAAQSYSDVAIVDAETMTLLSMTPICPTGHGMGLSPDGKELYLTCSLSDELAVLNVEDPKNPRIVTKLPVGPHPGQPGKPTYAPYALTVHPTTGLVWVSNNQSFDVRVYDPAKQQMDASKVIPVGGVAMFSDFSPDGSLLYVPHQGDDRVTEITLSTLQLRDLALPPAGCLAAHALRVLSPQSAAVVCEGDHIARKGTVVMLDLAAWATRGYVEVGLFPDGLTELPAQ